MPASTPVPVFPRSWRTWAALFALWTVLGVIGLSRYFFFHFTQGIPLPLAEAFWLMMAWYIAVPFTPIMVWLGRRFPFRRERLPRTIGLHAGAALLCSAGLGALYTLLISGGHLLGLDGADAVFHSLTRTGPDAPFDAVLFFRTYVYGNVITDLGVYTIIVALTNAVMSQRESRERALRMANLETELVEAQLHALRMQLNPHFLFNTLHTISVIMDEDVKAARRMMVDLSDLLRMALDSMQDQLVPLEQELRFIERYLSIEQERFRNRLTVTYEIAPGLHDALVPNFILQPLAENAIKHGIAPFAQGGSLTIRARQDGDTLELQVQDSGPGLSDQAVRAATNGKGAGVGLQTTRQRLRHLYGDDHVLTMSYADDVGFTVTLRLPYYTAVLESVE